MPLGLLTSWLAWAQLPGHGLLSPGAPATGEAEWIWIDGQRIRRAPVAFYAVREIELEEPAPDAELMVLADEEYQAFVNRRWIGFGAWRPGARVDRYAVGHLLRPGRNRLVIEVRSGRGAGGLLACLVDPPTGRVLAASDGGWRIAGQHAEGLFEGWGPIEHLPHAVSWGLPPTGRWGPVEEGPLRAATPGGTRLPPARVRPLGGGAWRPPAAAVRVQRPARGRAGVLLDWGRPVSGHLSVRLLNRDGLRTALLFTGTEPVDPLGGVSIDSAGTAAGGDAGNGTARTGAPAEDRDGHGHELDGDGTGAPGDRAGAGSDAAVIVIPGRRGWTDAVARRFRYAAVLGTTPVVEAWVDPPADWEEVAEPLDGRREGVFGIAPPPLRTPVEDEVWRQLESLARRRDR